MQLYFLNYDSDIYHSPASALYLQQMEIEFVPSYQVQRSNRVHLSNYWLPEAKIEWHYNGNNYNVAQRKVGKVLILLVSASNRFIIHLLELSHLHSRPLAGRMRRTFWFYCSYFRQLYQMTRYPEMNVVLLRIL